MSLFSFHKKRPGDLESLVQQIRVDLQNNYKDEATASLKKLKSLLSEKQSAGTLKPVDASYYTGLVADFEKDMQNFRRTY